MEELTFEEFFEDTWDYVSDHVVDQDCWDENQPFIRDLTFDLYHMYKNSIIKTSYNDVIFNPLSPKISGKLIEIFFTNFDKHKIINGKRTN